MGEDPAEMGRHAQRAADIGPERERTKARGERGRRAARRAPGGSPKIVRIVGDPVDGVVGLPVVEPEGHVGLAEDHRAGSLDAAHDQRILRGPVVARFRIAPGGRSAGEIEALLDRHGHAEQRAALAARQPHIGLRSFDQRNLVGLRAHRIERGVRGFDPLNRVAREFDGGGLPRSQRLSEIRGGCVSPLRTMHRRLPRSRADFLLSATAAFTASGSNLITALLLAPLSKIVIHLKSSAEQGPVHARFHRVSLRHSSIARDAGRQHRGSQKQCCRLKATGTFSVDAASNDCTEFAFRDALPGP